MFFRSFPHGLRRFRRWWRLTRLGILIESERAGTAFDGKWIWISAFLILGLVLLRFLFDYLRARCQESISYELAARDRLAIGEALKRVSLGYFQQVDTGNILNSITTGLHSLENMGMRMLDTFVGGYLNFLCIFLFLLFFSPLVCLIALAGAAVSFLFLLLVSRHSVKKCTGFSTGRTGSDSCSAGVRKRTPCCEVLRAGRSIYGGCEKCFPGQPGYLPEDRMGIHSSKLPASSFR